MRTKTVHYLSLYNIPAFYKEQRRFSPSGKKMEYIVEKLLNIGYRVHFVSFSESKLKKLFFPKSKRVSANYRFFLTPYVPCRLAESIAFRWFSFIYAPLYCKRGDVLLVYHTNTMRNDILKKVADRYGMTFVYEVEEIYAHIHETVDARQVEEELRALQCPDRYLFCTEGLANAVNRRDLPYSVVHGVYKNIPQTADGFGDGKIHCVYGGILDTLQGGAVPAIRAAEHLDERYVIHILGYGDTDLVRREIAARTGGCQVVFDGLKLNEEYDRFLSMCHIGLNTRTISNTFNTSSFPSKVLYYLCHGLAVVSGDISCVRESGVGDLCTYYSTDDPRAIAEAILRVDVSGSRKIPQRIAALDKSFEGSLRKLLED